MISKEKYFYTSKILLKETLGKRSSSSSTTGQESGELGLSEGGGYLEPITVA